MGKIGMFLAMVVNFRKKDGGKLRKKACKNAYLGSIFMSGKDVFRVCFESPYDDDIQPEIQVPPPRGFMRAITII